MLGGSAFQRRVVTQQPICAAGRQRGCYQNNQGADIEVVFQENPRQLYGNIPLGKVDKIGHGVGQKNCGSQYT